MPAPSCYDPKGVGKFKPARRRARAAAPKGGWPCLILLFSGLILIMLLLYVVLKNAGG